MISVPLDTFLEGEIYVDTMVFYVLLRAEEKVHPLLKGFFECIETGKIIAYTSGLSFDELSYRLILALIKDKYGGSPLEQLRARETALLKEFAPIVVPKLQLLQGFPNLQIVEIMAKDIQAMLQNMLDYPLKPRDALHLATMQRLGCFNLASNDHHLDVVPALRRFFIEIT